jgi:hypothetical protein
MSKLIDGLTQLMNERGNLSTDALVERASRIMDKYDKGRGWEYGPDFERQDIDAFAISIGWDLAQKCRLDQMYALPREGEGWRIVSGILPRDADQFVVFGEREIEASLWRFILEPKSGSLTLQMPEIARRQQLQIAENIVLAEVGEVNAARFITELKTAGELSPEALPLSNFAKTFAQAFPDCEFNKLLLTKVAGRTRRA